MRRPRPPFVTDDSGGAGDRPARVSSRTIREGPRTAIAGAGFVTDDSRGVGTARAPAERRPQQGDRAPVSHPRRTTGPCLRTATPPTNIAPAHGAPQNSSRPPPGSPSPLLQPRLPPTCLRAPARLRHQRTVRPLPGQVKGDVWAGTGYERGGSIAPFGQTHAHAHQRSPGGPPARNVVRPPRPSDHRSILQHLAPKGLPVMHQHQPSHPAALRHQPVERAVPPAIAARRHGRSPSAATRRDQLDSDKLSGVGLGAGTSRTNTCSR